MHTNPYFRLMRLHQPAGIWLLLWPCWWSVALASYGIPPLLLLGLFAVGAVLMRGAGCIVNDLTDRKLDQQVERTKTRPLASGEIVTGQAILLLSMLVATSAGIAMLMGHAVLIWSALSLVPVIIYPWSKRFTWWPQLFLGLTFNWGALLGWAATRQYIGETALLLYIGCLFWTLGYDTIYAHQDKKDDLIVGIKSSALRLGAKTKPALWFFYGSALCLWALAAFSAHCGIIAYGVLLLAAGHMIWQIRTVLLDDPASCLRIFFSNVQLGWIVFFAFMLGRTIPYGVF